MRFVPLAIAAVLALLAGFIALKFPAGKTSVVSVSPAIATVDVLVARAPIEMGMVIKESMINHQAWPRTLVPEGFITAEDAVIGKVARASFAAHEPLIAGKLIASGSLAMDVGAGMRAVTIATDMVSSVGGYVLPGDRVDILFAHNIPLLMTQGNAPISRNDKPSVVELLLPAVRVLAVGSRNASAKEIIANASNVTVEVDEDQAQKLLLAQKIGSLSLALRPLGEAVSVPVAPTPLSAIMHEEEERITVVRGVRVDTIKIARAALPEEQPVLVVENHGL